MSEPNFSGRVLGGRYRVGRLLGRGGMGMVYEAHQEDLGRRVAIKVLRSDSVEALDRFEREARAAAALGNPHIVQIFDFSPADPPFLVMELLAGETLAEALKREGPLAAPRVARIGVHVLSALAAAHGQGILHRDIKPANVFLTQSPTLGEIAKVLDFGIAKLASGHQITQAGMVIGTATYMSPEQATGGELDARADVYSTAVTLYRALSGWNPFAGTSPEQLLSAILHGAATPLGELRPELDPALVQIVARGMAPDRSLRFQSADEMARALDDWLRAPPPRLPAPVVSAPPPAAPPGRSGGGKLLVGVAALGLLGVVALLALGVGGFFAVQSGVFDSEPAVAFGDAGAPRATPSSAPRASAASTAPVAVEAGAAEARAKPSRGSGTDAGTPVTPPDAGATPAPAGPASALDAPCTPESGCDNGLSCVAGRCACGSGRTLCGGECVQTLLNGNHCGKCFNACAPTAVCNHGECKSCDELPGRALYKGSCVFLLTDYSNCGACGVKCPVGVMCMQGKCKKP